MNVKKQGTGAGIGKAQGKLGGQLNSRGCESGGALMGRKVR